MINKIAASVYIICQNEETHIQRALESVRDFDEIIIVDSGSKDSTLEIAKRYTEKVYHQKWMGFATQKEYAKNLCTHEWVLNLDADEELSPQLRKEIEETIDRGDVDGLNIPVSSLYIGAFNHPWSKFNKRIRFFRKSKGYYPPKLVHESIVIKGNIKKSKGFIYDYGITDLQTHLSKINTYSTLRAQEKVTKGKKASIMKLLTIIPLAFIKSFILKRGFLNGLRGFIAAINNAYYAFLKEAKLYEHHRKELKR